MPDNPYDQYGGQTGNQSDLNDKWGWMFGEGGGKSPQSGFSPEAFVPDRTPNMIYGGGNDQTIGGTQGLGDKWGTSYNGSSRASSPSYGGSGGSGNGMMGGLTGLLLQESGQQQKLMDEQWARNNEQNMKMEGLVEGIPARISQQDKANKIDTEKSLGRLDEADQWTREGIATFEDAVAKFEDTSVQDMSLASKGIARNIESEFQQVKAQGNWGAMSEEERSNTQFQFANAKREQLSQALIPMSSQFNQSMASLRTGLASAKMQAGQALQNSAQLEAGIRQFNASASKAGVLEAINLQLQGRIAVADHIRENPKGMVSLFSGMLSLATAFGGGGGGGNGAWGAFGGGGTKSGQPGQKIGMGGWGAGTAKIPGGDNTRIHSANWRSNSNNKPKANE